MVKRNKRIIKKRENKKIPISSLKHKLIYAKNKKERNKIKKQIKLAENKKLKLERGNLKKFGTKEPYSEANLNRTLKILEDEKIDNKEVSDITYLNFYIAKTHDYVRGYIVTSKPVSIGLLKELCIDLISQRHPKMRISRFEVAKERGQINYTRLVLFRENEEIDSTLINL